jgi:hypothetical protein
VATGRGGRSALRATGGRAAVGEPEGRQRGARFRAAAFAVDSTIDLDLRITDGATGQQIARPRIAMNADAMTGRWSIGKSDEGLLDCITAATYQYRKDHD